MDPKKIIEVGLLESYVLGGLSDKEAVEVEKIISENPEVLSEFKALQEGLKKYVLIFEKKPSADIKAVCLEPFLNKPIQTKQKTALPKEAIKESVKKKSSSYGKVLAVFSIVVLIAAGSSAGYFWLNWNKAVEELQSASQKNTELASTLINHSEMEKELEKARCQLSSLKERLELLNDTVTDKVKFNCSTLPEMEARIFWNSTNYRTYIEIKNLSAAPEGKQYLVWAINDTIAHTAGKLIEECNDEFIRLNDIQQAKYFLLTLESKDSVSTYPDTLNIIGKADIVATKQ